MMLFHYKYLSFTRTHHRHQLLQQGLKSLDLEKGWGYKYFWDKAQFRADWNKIATSAVDTLLIRDDPEWRYPIPRWWEKYRN